MRSIGSQDEKRLKLSGNTDDNINILKTMKAELKTDSCLLSLKKCQRKCWYIDLVAPGDACTGVVSSFV